VDHLSAASGLRAWRGPTPPSAVVLSSVVICVRVSWSRVGRRCATQGDGNSRPDRAFAAGFLAFSELVHASATARLGDGTSPEATHWPCRDILDCLHEPGQEAPRRGRREWGVGLVVTKRFEAAALGGVVPRHARRPEAADRCPSSASFAITRDRESAGRSYEAPVVSSRHAWAGRARAGPRPRTDGGDPVETADAVRLPRGHLGSESTKPRRDSRRRSLHVRRHFWNAIRAGSRGSRSRSSSCRSHPRTWCRACPRGRAR
jgi:hypothetical protein